MITKTKETLLLSHNTRLPLDVESRFEFLSSYRISSKRDMCALAELGHFGNQLGAWKNPKEVFSHRHAGNVWFRYLAGSGWSECEFDVPNHRIIEVYEKWLLRGLDPELISINEDIPNRDTSLVGEVMRSIDHYDLSYSFSTLKRRDALSEHSLHASGLEALSILRHFMDPSSYDDLQRIFDWFPDSVVEFSDQQATNIWSSSD